MMRRVLTSPSIGCLWAVCLSCPGVLGQVVEDFVVAGGEPAFGEQPLIRGNIVAWRRYAGRDRSLEPPMIQFRDIGRGDSVVTNVAPYDAAQTGVYLSETHLFWGFGTVFARRIEDLWLGTEGPNVPVSTGSRARVLTASPNHVFLLNSEYVGPHSTGKYFAVPVDSLGNPEALGFVAPVKRVPWIGRHAAASERYFVWTDTDPDDPEATWMIYAKRTEDIFTPGAEFLVIDTRFRDKLGIRLSLNGSVVFFEASIDPTKRYICAQLYLLDIERGMDPIQVAATDRQDYFIIMPSLSEHYAVWREGDYFHSQGYGIRIEDGRPVGHRFEIGNPGSGSYITLDRNIAVWSGILSLNEELVVLGAVEAAELALPGATDVGDVDGDGRLGITDAIIILNHLYLGGWKPRTRLADANLDGRVDIADAVAILAHLFGGEPLPTP